MRRRFLDALGDRLSLQVGAIATLYVTAQGVEVVATGKRRWVDTHWFRGNSYFRIGWQWVKTALECGWQLAKSKCGSC